MSETNADQIISVLRQAGVVRLFGMPGGGSSADLIEAARKSGLPFTLAQTETGSAFMATAQAEITNAPGACIATLGPGAASVMNGVANAWLDRVPLVAITDCLSPAAAEVMQHQSLSHSEMLVPVAKLSVRAAAESAGQAAANAVRIAMRGQRGPVHIDLAGDVASAEATAPRPLIAVDVAPCQHEIPETAMRPILDAKRPVFLVGLGARSSPVSMALREIANRNGVPVFVTYKAKGVVADDDPWFAGVITNGSLEREILEQADLFIGAGFDPVELIPRAWKYPQPFISVTEWAMRQKQIPVTAEIVGAIAPALDHIGAALRPRSDWAQAEVARIAEGQRARMRVAANGNGIAPYRVAEIVAEVYAGCRATVDAGAHMFPVMSLWPAREPSGMLISNGLATMGFALPAAIGAALLEPERTVVAFSGDGGVLMCLGELRTAAREKARIRIIVFDDEALTLIQVKQEQRGFDSSSSTMGPVQWAILGRSMGMVAFEAASESELIARLQETRDHAGPVLIAAKVDPSAYPATMRALRG